jgi:hypothetical protein
MVGVGRGALSEARQGRRLDPVAPRSEASYRSGVRSFTRWCDSAGLVAIPARPATVANWIAASSLAPGTLKEYLTALRREHVARGHPDPTQAPEVRRALDRRTPQGQPRTPASRAMLVAALPTLDLFDAQACRDRALLLLGYAGLKPGELRALTLGDLEFTPRGLVVRVGDATCVIRSGFFHELDPVGAARDWLRALRARFFDMPPEAVVFRGVSPWGEVADRPLGVASVGTIVDRLSQGGFDSDGLWRGLLVDAAGKGVPDAALDRHRHRTGSISQRFGDALVRAVGL